MGSDVSCNSVSWPVPHAVSKTVYFRPPSGAVAKSLIVAIVCFICIVLLIRYEISNGFTVLPGDRFDGVITATILEHWFKVFSGQQSWSDVRYFFPYSRTIAQTDGYFLIGVAYARSAGLASTLSLRWNLPI